MDLRVAILFILLLATTITAGQRRRYERIRNLDDAKLEEGDQNLEMAHGIFKRNSAPNVTLSKPKPTFKPAMCIGILPQTNPEIRTRCATIDIPAFADPTMDEIGTTTVTNNVTKLEVAGAVIEKNAVNLLGNITSGRESDKYSGRGKKAVSGNNGDVRVSSNKRLLSNVSNIGKDTSRCENKTTTTVNVTARTGRVRAGKSGKAGASVNKGNKFLPNDLAGGTITGNIGKVGSVAVGNNGKIVSTGNIIGDSTVKAVSSGNNGKSIGSGNNVVNSGKVVGSGNVAVGNNGKVVNSGINTANSTVDAAGFGMKGYNNDKSRGSGNNVVNSGKVVGSGNVAVGNNGKVVNSGINTANSTVIAAGSGIKGNNNGKSVGSGKKVFNPGKVVGAGGKNCKAICAAKKEHYKIKIVIAANGAITTKVNGPKNKHVPLITGNNSAVNIIKSIVSTTTVRTVNVVKKGKAPSGKTKLRRLKRRMN